MAGGSPPELFRSTPAASTETSTLAKIAPAPISTPQTLIGDLSRGPSAMRAHLRHTSLLQRIECGMRKRRALRQISRDKEEPDSPYSQAGENRACQATQHASRIGNGRQ